MKIDRMHSEVQFRGEDGSFLRVYYDNRGDPYRQGATVRVTDGFNDRDVSVFLEERELRELFDLLKKFFPLQATP